MNVQDFKPIVFYKKSLSKDELQDPRKLQDALRHNNVNTLKKMQQPSSAPIVSAKKMEKNVEEGVLRHYRIPEHLRKAIIKARNEKKFTQVQLAQQINEKPQVIQDYENGKAIPSCQILSKLSRVLGVHLDPWRFKMPPKLPLLKAV